MRTAPFVPSALAEVTHNEQSSLRLKTSSTASTSSPVHSLLARKLENIEIAAKELPNVTAQKENFERIYPKRFSSIKEHCQSVENATLNWGILDDTVMAKTAHRSCFVVSWIDIRKKT